MRYLHPARNRILPRMSFAVLLTVYPSKITGFSTYERLANIIGVTRLNCSSLQNRKLSELSMVHYFPMPQRYFNLNGKLGYMAFSSIRYIFNKNARLVAYR
jgi:hypothetical protein